MSTVPAPASGAFSAGDVLGSYRLVRALSRGGFGQVWIGQHLHLEDYWAVKIVPLGPLGAVELAGVRNYRALTAPGLLPVRDFECVPPRGCYFYTMPLADDASGAVGFQSPAGYQPMTLAQYRRIHRPLPLDRVLAVLLNLLPALHAVHEQGFIHRDIKPDNVVRLGGTWRLCDVGLLVRGDRGPGRAGTEWFLPPQGNNNNRQADLYALGRTTYLLATEHDRAHFPDFLAGTIGVPGADGRRGGLEAVIRRACAPAPGDRYQTAVEMYEAIQPLVRRTKVTLVLEENYDSFNGPRRDEVVACFREHGFCVSTPPAFERGSVRVTVELPPDEAQRLEFLAGSGQFGKFKTSGAEWGAPGPGFKFRLLLSAAGFPDPRGLFDRYVVGPCAAEVARARGLRVEKEQVESPLPTLGTVWTGAVEFAVDDRGGLKALCRSLWVGVRDLLRGGDPFELEVETGAGRVRLRSEDLRALGRDPGREPEALETLLTGAVPGLRHL